MNHYLSHLLVWGEVLLVLWVLEVVLLDVSPELLDALCAGSFLLAHDVSQLSAQLHGLGKSGSLRHLEEVWVLKFGFEKNGKNPANKNVKAIKYEHCN